LLLYSWTVRHGASAVTTTDATWSAIMNIRGRLRGPREIDKAADRKQIGTFSEMFPLIGMAASRSHLIQVLGSRLSLTQCKNINTPFYGHVINISLHWDISRARYRAHHRARVFGRSTNIPSRSTKQSQMMISARGAGRTSRKFSTWRASARYVSTIRITRQLASPRVYPVNPP
jgi:hypothetical protein